MVMDEGYPQRAPKHLNQRYYRQTCRARGAKDRGKSLARDYNKINTVVSIIILMIASPPFVAFCYNALHPIRAELTISVDDFSLTRVNNSTTAFFLTLPIRVADYSPKEAYITEWSLWLDFSGTSLQISNQNCTYGNTNLSPAQQTEFLYSFKVNDTQLSRLSSSTFSISYIDYQGTLQEQFESYYPHENLAIDSSGTIA